MDLGLYDAHSTGNKLIVDADEEPPAATTASELQNVLVFGGFDGEAVTGDLLLLDPGMPASSST